MYARARPSHSPAPTRSHRRSPRSAVRFLISARRPRLREGGHPRTPPREISPQSKARAAQLPHVAEHTDARGPLGYCVRRSPAMFTRVIHHLLFDLVADLRLHRLGNVSHAHRVVASGRGIRLGSRLHCGLRHCRSLRRCSRSFLRLRMGSRGVGFRLPDEFRRVFFWKKPAVHETIDQVNDDIPRRCRVLHRRRAELRRVCLCKECRRAIRLRGRDRRLRQCRIGGMARVRDGSGEHAPGRREHLANRTMRQTITERH